MAQMVKNPPAMQETQVQSLSWEDPLEKKREVAKSCLTLCDSMDYIAHQAFCPGNSLGKNTGGDCYSLLQGIFPTQGLNLGLLHYRQVLYHLSHKRRNPKK